MEDTILKPILSKAQLAKQLGVSRTYITLLIQGKRQPSQQLANKMRQLQLTEKLPIEFSRMHMGLEPVHDPKSCAVDVIEAQIKDSQAQSLHMIKNHVPALRQQQELLNMVIDNRRQGLSPNTTAFYRNGLAHFIGKYELTPDSINRFLGDLRCSPGAKLCYFRALRVFINWLVKNGLLNDNPLKNVDPPKPMKRILPSLTEDHVNQVIDCEEDTATKAMVSLFADRGVRLQELINIKATDIDWEHYTVRILGKGNKQRRAVFTERTARMA